MELEGQENNEMENQIDETSEDTSQVDETTEETVEEGQEETQEAEETEENSEGGEEEGQEDEEEANAEEGQETHKPSTKFKFGFLNKETGELEQKEQEIDKRFHGLMKTPEGEKLVRELHEKAYGLESVKERHNQTRQQLQTVSAENQNLHKGINGLRQIYHSTLQTGNYHKFDSFLERLKIPQDFIFNYVYEKMKLLELPPEQRNQIMQGIQADRRADEAVEAQQEFTAQQQNLAYENKQLQLDMVLQNQEVSQLAAAFDERVGKPGAFRAAVEREGNVAWHTSKGKVDLTPAQAVQAVIKNYALDSTPLIPGAKPAQGNVGAVTTQKVVATKPRGTKTIPNVSSRGSVSPLKDKPKSIDDVIKYRKETYGS
jgi:hypothetical protein